MTRWLSEVLGTQEPFFRSSLLGVEQANGQPNHDIRLSSDVLHQTRAKLRELGLDPQDTTARELYAVLQQRVQADDAKLVKTLRTLAASHVSAEGDVVDGMVHALKALPDSKRCFALKGSVLKDLMKKQPPKKAVKRLGYRSFDSFLKHEPAASQLAAAWLSEGPTWQKKFREQYKQLGPGSFEDRQISIARSDSKHWAGLAKEVVEQTKHTVLSFKELGAIIILPFPSEPPAGAVTVSLSLALHELNEIRAASTFLKLSQVRADFGRLVQKVAAGEPELSSRLLDQPISWQLIQRYMTRLGQEFQEAVLGPHIQLEDLSWHDVEASLAKIEPSLAFWKQSAHLGLLHDHQSVSMNLLDAALNYCNQLPFEKRIVHYFRRSLWHELLLRYLRADTVEQSVLAELQPELATETVSV